MHEPRADAHPDGAERTTADRAIAGRRLETIWIPPREPRRSPLVFLHEGLGSIGLWKRVPEEIAALTGCGVLVYSRYGNGYSEALHEARAPAFMHDEALTVLPELLEAFGLGKVTLVGHSDGASIALIYAGSYPERVRGLVLEAPHVFVEDLSVRSIAQAKVAYETTGLRAKLARYHADVDGTFFGWNDIWLHPAFRTWNIETYAGGLRCPSLLLQGACDEYGTAAQIDAIRRLAVDAPVDTLVLARCGHSPHRDRPGLALPAMAAFIRNLE